MEEKLSLIQKALRKIGLTAVEVKLEQQTLADGMTIVEYDSLEANSPIAIVTDNGNVDLEPGKYTLQDGTVIMVNQKGLIGEVKPAEAPEAEPAVEVEVEAEKEPAPAPQAKKTVESTVKETYFEEIEQLKAENAKLKDENEALKVKMSEVEKEKELALSETPAAKPIQHNPENKTEVKPVKLGASIEQNVRILLNR